MIEQVAHFVANAVPDHGVHKRSANYLVDTVGVMIAGSAQIDVNLLRDALDSSALIGTGTQCLWSDRTYHSEDAALLYGMASHVLDYDDVSLLAICHPSAPVTAALLASDACAAASGPELLAAYAVGTEVMIRVGMAMGPVHYALGFHATATLGTIGATAAIARLSKLDTAHTRQAFNIAASLAGGLQSNFGSSAKSLHVGFAASSAVRAVSLARANLAASADAFAPNGFLHAFSGGQVNDWPEGFCLGEPFAIADPGFEQKRFPCCYMLHRMLAGTLELRTRHGFTLDDVSKITLSYPTGGTIPLRYPRPETGMQGLFSAPYACVAALADGAVNLTSFTDAAILRNAVQARLPDVAVIEKPELLRTGGLSTSPVHVEIELCDGTIVAKLVEQAPGSNDAPMSEVQQREKWHDCLRQAIPWIDRTQSERIREAGLNLATSNVAPWLKQIRSLAVARPA